MTLKLIGECISENPVIANFWMNTSTQYYLQFQGKLLVAGLFVRKTFYNFLHELQDGAYGEKIEKINMRITPTYIDGKINKKAILYYRSMEQGNNLFINHIRYKK